LCKFDKKVKKLDKFEFVYKILRKNRREAKKAYVKSVKYVCVVFVSALFVCECLVESIVLATLSLSLSGCV